MTDEQAIKYTFDRLAKVKQSHKRDFKGSGYILGALLQYRAAKNGGVQGLLRFYDGGLERMEKTWNALGGNDAVIAYWAKKEN